MSATFKQPLINLRKLFNDFYGHKHSEYVTPDSYASELKEGRNILINGNFDVWQRGTSFVSPANGTTYADRWRHYSNMGAVTIARSTDVPTLEECGSKSNYSVHVDVTTALATPLSTSLFELAYLMEGYDYARLAGGYITVSFWVKCTKVGIYSVSVKNTGGDRSYTTDYVIYESDTWEKKTVTIPMTETGGTWNYLDGTGIFLLFPLASGSTYQAPTTNTWNSGDYTSSENQVNAMDSTANNFRIARVQLEKGSVCTPLEPKLYTDELSRCQRYYWKGKLAGSGYAQHYGILGNVGLYAGSFSYTRTMRTSPTLATVTAPTYQNCTLLDIVGGVDGFSLRVDPIASGMFRAHSGIYTADAEL